MNFALLPRVTARLITKHHSVFTLVADSARFQQFLPGERLILCKRWFNFSPINLKRDKYSLNFLPGRRKGASGTGTGVKPGRASSGLFTLDSDAFWDHKDKNVQTAKMSMISYSLLNAISSMLVSSDISSEIQREPIDVIKVQMSGSLTHATVFWKLDVAQDDLEREKHVQHLLDERTEEIQAILPTFHTMTHTPSVRFELYHFYREEKRMTDLFTKVRDDLGNTDAQPDNISMENQS